MARHQRESLRGLAEAERAELERLSRSGSERVDRVRRATALLAVAEGQLFVAAERAGLALLCRDEAGPYQHPYAGTRPLAGHVLAFFSTLLP